MCCTYFTITCRVCIGGFPNFLKKAAFGPSPIKQDMPNQKAFEARLSDGAALLPLCALPKTGVFPGHAVPPHRGAPERIQKYPALLLPQEGGKVLHPLPGDKHGLFWHRAMLLCRRLCGTGPVFGTYTRTTASRGAFSPMVTDPLGPFSDTKQPHSAPFTGKLCGCFLQYVPRWMALSPPDKLGGRPSCLS